MNRLNFNNICCKDSGRDERYELTNIQEGRSLPGRAPDLRLSFQALAKGA